MRGTTTESAAAAAKQTNACPLGIAPFVGTLTSGCTSGYASLGRARPITDFKSVEIGSATRIASSVATTGMGHRRRIEMAAAMATKIRPQYPTTDSTFART